MFQTKYIMTQDKSIVCRTHRRTVEYNTVADHGESTAQIWESHDNFVSPYFLYNMSSWCLKQTIS